MSDKKDVRVLSGLKQGDDIVFSFVVHSDGGSIHVLKVSADGFKSSALTCLEVDIEKAEASRVKRLLVESVERYALLIQDTLPSDLSLQFLGCFTSLGSMLLEGVSELFSARLFNFLSEAGFSEISRVVYKIKKTPDESGAET